MFKKQALQGVFLAGVQYRTSVKTFIVNNTPAQNDKKVFSKTNKTIPHKDSQT